MLRLIPPVGSPIVPRLSHVKTDFDWTFCGRYQPFFVDSGTSALRLAIAAANVAIGSNSTVWLPAYGCPDLVSATIAAGAGFAFYDIGPSQPFLREGVTPPTDVGVAVIAHFLGLTAPAEAMRRVMRPGTILIEDSAQNFPPPLADDGGDFVVLSFGRGKPVSLLFGGCLLARPHLATVTRTLIESWPEDQHSPALKLRCRVHDFLIRPRVYGFVSRLPGFQPGEVKVRPVRRPFVATPSFIELASRAANAYLNEKNWIDRQQRVAALAQTLFPLSSPLSNEALAKPLQRLLRLPLLLPDRHAAADAIGKMAALGVCATQMYKQSLLRIPGVPVPHTREQIGADAFASRLITLPITNHWP